MSPTKTAVINVSTQERRLMSSLSGDFRSRRLTFQPKSEDIISGVNVPIMERSALGTYPLSYSQPFLAFRATPCTARRTGYGTKSFVDLNKHSRVLASFVFQHVSEGRPPSITNRLSQVGALEMFGIHIANDDQTVLTRNFGAFTMQKVTPCIYYLCMDCLDAALIAGALSDCKLLLIFSKNAGILYNSSVAKSGKTLKAQINPNSTVASRERSLHLASKADVPASTGVLSKATNFYFSDKWPTIPVMDFSTPINYRAVTILHTSTREWYPAEAFLARAKARASFFRLSSLSKDTASFVNRISINPKFRGRLCEHGKRKITWPPSLPFLGVPLCFAAIIPDIIYRAGAFLKISALRTVLNPIFVSEHHFKNSNIFQTSCKAQGTNP